MEVSEITLNGGDLHLLESILYHCPPSCRSVGFWCYHFRLQSAKKGDSKTIYLHIYSGEASVTRGSYYSRIQSNNVLRRKKLCFSLRIFLEMEEGPLDEKYAKKVGYIAAPLWWVGFF